MSTMIMNKIISCLCVFLLVFSPTVTLAQEAPTIDDLARGKVTQVSKGEEAPFDGVLLSPEAAATLFGDLKFSQKECQLRLDKELKLNTTALTAQIDLFKLRLEIEQTRSAGLMIIKNERIEFLEENWRPTPWYQSGEFWLAVGVVAGVLITVGAGHAVGQVSNNSNN